MIKHSKALILAGLLVPGVALAQVNEGDSLGTLETDIRAALESQGYTILEFETEDDEIEVDVTLDGQAFDIEISPETGLVLEIEAEDDADSEDS